MRRLPRILFPLAFLALFVGLTFAAFGAAGDPATSTQVVELAESGAEVIVVDRGPRVGFFPFFLGFFALLFLAKAFAFGRWARRGDHGGHRHGGPWGSGGPGAWQERLEQWHTEQHVGDPLAHADLLPRDEDTPRDRAEPRDA